MKFSGLISAIESKKDSIDQLKNLVHELESEIKFLEKNVRVKNHEIFKAAIRERYTRMANRVIKDLFFVADDFVDD